MAKQKPYFTYGVHASDRDLITSTTQYSGQLKRYFSSLDAEIFISGERILDIVRLDFSYEEKKLPFYGFNSFWPSRIFTGQKIIQGTFAINFTEPGYIAKLLQRIKASEMQGDTEIVGQSCSLENSPLFAKSFDILVGYGGWTVDGQESFRNTHQELQGVYINGYQQILDISGEPVMEVYSFIAKNLKFGGYEYDNSNSNSNSSDNSDSDSSGSSMVESIEKIEKRLTAEVADLENRCNKNEKLLGITIDTMHSLHIKDKESHIYVDFGFFNGIVAETYIMGNVKLTIHDNEVNLSETIDLVKMNGNTYGKRIDTERTNKIKKKLNGTSQQLVSCTVEFSIMHNGKKQPPLKHRVYMRRGVNY